MHIVSLGDNLHEVSDPIFLGKKKKKKKKKKKSSVCRLLNLSIAWYVLIKETKGI